jgi:hypothetical protein
VTVLSFSLAKDTATLPVILSKLAQRRGNELHCFFEGFGIDKLSYDNLAQLHNLTEQLISVAKPRLKRKTRQFVIAAPTDRCLWHLFSTNESYKLDAFLSGQLYLARLDRFKDDLEGTLPRRNRNLLNKAPPFAKKYIRDEYSKAVRQSFASCWHRSSDEPSDYMWKEFGNNYNGIAIRTSPRRMLKAVKPFMTLGAGHFGRIRYIDHNRDLIRTWNILRAHFVVRSDFQEENEARLLLHTFGRFGGQLVAYSGPRGPLVRIRRTRTTPPRHEFVGGYKRGTSVLLEIKPKEFIEEIVLGKGVADSVYQSVLRRAAALGIRCRRLR